MSCSFRDTHNHQLPKAHTQTDTQSWTLTAPNWSLMEMQTGIGAAVPFLPVKLRSANTIQHPLPALMSRSWLLLSFSSFSFSAFSLASLAFLIFSSASFLFWFSFTACWWIKKTKKTQLKDNPNPVYIWPGVGSSLKKVFISFQLCVFEACVFD